MFILHRILWSIKDSVGHFISISNLMHESHIASPIKWPFTSVWTSLGALFHQLKFLCHNPAPNFDIILPMWPFSQTPKQALLSLLRNKAKSKARSRNKKPPWLSLNLLLHFLNLLHSKTSQQSYLWLLFVLFQLSFSPHFIPASRNFLSILPATSKVNVAKSNGKFSVFLLFEFSMASNTTDLSILLVAFSFLGFCDTKIPDFVSCLMAATPVSLVGSFSTWTINAEVLQS